MQSMAPGSVGIKEGLQQARTLNDIDFAFDIHFSEHFTMAFTFDLKPRIMRHGDGTWITSAGHTGCDIYGTPQTSN
jgi:hypothetical protein